MVELEKVENQKRKAILLRFNILFFLIFFLFVLLILQLAYVQLVKGEEYLAESNTITTRTIPIISLRGSIYDRDGFPLVKNRASFTAVFQEGNLSKEETIQLAKRLGDVFQLDPATVIKEMDVGYDIEGKPTVRKNSKFTPKKIKSDLSNEEMAYLEENRNDFPGIDVVVESIREYSPDTIAVQAIGYLKPYGVAKTLPAVEDRYQGKDSQYLPWEPVGIDGVELQYEDTLKGTNGYRKVAVDSKERVLHTVETKQAIPGNSVYLTIDRDVQLATESAIEEHLKWLRSKDAGKNQAPNAKTAYAVALEVETGKVVAMASYPDYDPNIWQYGSDNPDDWAGIGYRMVNGTMRSALYDPTPLPPEESQKHPASILPIGSTAKPLTVLIGLAEGIISPNDVWNDTGKFQYGRNEADTVRNSEGHIYGRLTPQKAIQKSSNTYMARIGYEMVMRLNDSISVFQKYNHLFGLGIKTGIDLPFESSGVEDYIVSAQRVSKQFALAQAGFGQQQKYTALQLAQYTSTIANNGKRIRPRIVDRIVDIHGNLVEEFKPEVLSETDIPQKYFDIVKEGMEMVTQQGGTAYYAFSDFPYPVAAKTGTSEQEIYVPNDPSDFSKGWHKDRVVENAVFISYAPADKPKLAVAVIVPEGGYGSIGAAPIARKIYEAYDQYIGLRDDANVNTESASINSE